MKGITIKGLYKESYGDYEGRFVGDDQQIYLTTDRYFEKYVLVTNDGVYEIWAGGIKKKEDILIEDFKSEPAFESMNGLVIADIQIEEEKSLIIHFETGEHFKVGLCQEFNTYNHPERYMKFYRKSKAGNDPS